MTYAEAVFWYEEDLWEACEDVEYILDYYGDITHRELCRIADRWQVILNDILCEFGWLR